MCSKSALDYYAWSVGLTSVAQLGASHTIENGLDIARRLLESLQFFGGNGFVTKLGDESSHSVHLPGGLNLLFIDGVAVLSHLIYYD